MAKAMIGQKLVYIAGPGHSGSTLLDMLLGGHSQISSLGEIHRFYLSMNRSTRPHRCDCGSILTECPFWKEIILGLTERTGKTVDEIRSSFYTTDPAYLDRPDDGLVLARPSVPKRYPLDLGRLIAGLAPNWVYRMAAYCNARVSLYRRIARNSHLLFDVARKVAGTPVIVDSTKNPIRLRALYLERPAEVKVIYLIRDGRAVTHSRMKRENVGMGDAAKVWVAEHRKQRIVQRAMSPKNVLTLRYENLCMEPEVQLRMLCYYLDLDFDPNVLTFRENTRHAVGGNPMRFDMGNRKIQLNEDWREALKESELEEFERVGGSLNRALGYE